MNVSRHGWAAVAVVLAGTSLFAGCGRRQPVEVRDITPSFEINRQAAPLGSAVEITYTWETGAGFEKLDQDFRSFVHFLDSHEVMLFEDDHMPDPAPSTWEANQTYSYRRTKFIPIYPYVGEAEVRVGMTPASGRGERLALKGEDAGLHEYPVAHIDLLPQTENIFLVFKDGWHNPEAFPDNPSLERTWTKQEALISFKNPGASAIVYLEADTNYDAFQEPPVLTVSVGENETVIPIESSEVFLQKIRLSPEVLGDGDWVDLKLAVSESFVPKEMGLNEDERELGLLVYHLYVVEEQVLGSDLGEVIDVEAQGEVMDAGAQEEAAE